MSKHGIESRDCITWGLQKKWASIKRRVSNTVCPQDALAFTKASETIALLRLRNTQSNTQST